MNRRELLKLTGLLALGPACNFLRAPASVVASGATTQVLPKEVFYCGYRMSETPYDHHDSGLVSVTTEGIKKHNLKVEIHSVLYSKSRDLKIYISKLENVSYYQIGDGELKPFSPGKGNYFYGHGVIDEREGILYTTQSRATRDRQDIYRRKEDGYLYAYSLPDMKLLGRFPTFGRDPHDMKILGEELIVCNGGEYSNVVFIDRTTKKLKASYSTPLQHISLRHIDIIDPDNFVIAPLTLDQDKSCMLFLLNRQRGLIPWKAPEEIDLVLMRHQLLSVLVYKGHIFATCPNTDTLLVWDLEGSFSGAHKIVGASSLVASPNHGGILIGSGEHGVPFHLAKVSGKQIQLSALNWGRGAIGSHAFLV
jgi:hypothetical protein